MLILCRTSLKLNMFPAVSCHWNRSRLIRSGTGNLEKSQDQKRRARFIIIAGTR